MESAALGGECGTKDGWVRGQDLNLRPPGYEPDELPDCSTPLGYYGRSPGESQGGPASRWVLLAYALIWVSPTLSARSN